MARGFSTGLAVPLLDSLGNAGTGAQNFYNNAILELRSGTRPATADTAPTGTIGASITLPADAMAAASSHSMVKNGTWQDASADASVTVTWGRFRLAGDAGTTNTTDKRMDCDLTVTGGGGDITFDTVAFIITQPVTITAYQDTLPA